MKNHGRFGAFFLLTFYSALSAQDPPGIRWKQIETNNYLLIFPKEISEDAKRAANTLEGMYSHTGQEMGGKHRKIPIVMRNRSAIPNAYVTQRPWHSEWNHIPLVLKEMGTVEWYQLLAIHEGRHMFQYGHLNRRINRLWSWLGGEGTQAIATGLMIPGWVWEGDAVVTETVLTESGRGRQPYFNREIRALLLDVKSIGYRQALHGSFRNEYPNHYYYGFLFASHIRRNYGEEAMAEIMNHTTRWPIIRNPFFPLSSAARRVTGRNISLLFRDTMDEMADAWQSQIKDNSFTPHELLSPPVNDGRVDYLFPGFDADGRLYAVRRGLGEKTALLRLHSGRKSEVIVQMPGVVEMTGLKIGGRYAVWNEIQPDRRWTKQSWSNIILYDLTDGHRRQVTQKGKFYYPSLSLDGSHIAAVEFTETRDCILVVLETETGELVKKYPSNSMILHPRWSEDGSEIVFISQDSTGRAISVIDVFSGSVTPVKLSSREEIYRPLFHGEFIIYESPISGIDNIYAIHRSTGESFRLISSRIAATNAAVSPDGLSLIFNDYSREGDRVVSTEFNSESWQAIEDMLFWPDTMVDELVSANHQSEVPTSIMDYSIRDYNHLSGFFSFHTWGLFPNIDEPTISIRSDNVLGTGTLFGRSSYNRNEETLYHEIRGVYKGWYPMISGGFGWGERSSPDTVQVFLERGDSATSHVVSRWRESSFDLRVTLPLLNRLIGSRRDALNLSSTIQRTVMSNRKVSFTWPQRDDLPDTTIPNQAADGTIFPLSMELNYANEVEGAVRDVMPRRGSLQNFAYTTTPFKSDFKGSRTYLGLTFYLPGFFKHDAVRFSSAFERKRDDGYPFRSLVEIPLGHSYRFHQRVTSFEGIYRAPLLYPESGIDLVPFLRWLRFGYLKRVSLDLRAHWLRGEEEEGEADYFTIGSGMTFDVTGFHLPFILPVTFLYAYRPLEGIGALEVLVDF
tara:strand:+ start:2784 stop:5669 length:2886 start_codon:yes stop_codon:yes gene_type:complete